MWKSCGRSGDGSRSYSQKTAVTPVIHNCRPQPLGAPFQGTRERRFVGGKPALRGEVEVAPSGVAESAERGRWRRRVLREPQALPVSECPGHRGGRQATPRAGLPGFGLRSPPGSPPRSGASASAGAPQRPPTDRRFSARGCARGASGSPRTFRNGPTPRHGPNSAQGASAVGGIPGSAVTCTEPGRLQEASGASLRRRAAVVSQDPRPRRLFSIRCSGRVNPAPASAPSRSAAAAAAGDAFASRFKRLNRHASTAARRSRGEPPRG